MVIEEAARILSAEGKEEANVVNRRGKRIGTLSMATIIAAMVPPQEPAPDVVETAEAEA